MTALVARGMILSALLVVLSGHVAQASSVSVGGGVMTITAQPGEANDISFAGSGSDTRGPLVRVTDSGSNDSIPNSTSGGRIVAGGSCDQDSTGRNARCPTNGLTSVVINLGDRDDEYDGSPERVATQLDLGAGDDEAKLDTRSGVLNNLEGGTGDDTLDIGRSSGTDVVSGGDDRDTASYLSRTFGATGTNGLTIRLDAVANDGNSSEGDNVQPNVEKVTGSSRNDELFGSTGPDTLEGALGVDSFTGNAGTDTYLLRDGVRDNSFCLQRGETVDRDLKDPAIFLPCGFTPLPIQIDVRVFTGAVREGPNVRILSRRLRIRRGGRVRVKLGCPARLRRGCKGRLTVREASRRLRRLAGVRYRRLRAGRRRYVSVRLGRRARRRARRRHAVALRAVERGRFGPKTTYTVRRIR
jgi:Ca2+-binding RTX toxin-like protein